LDSDAIATANELLELFKTVYTLKVFANQYFSFDDSPGISIRHYVQKFQSNPRLPTFTYSDTRRLVKMNPSNLRPAPGTFTLMVNDDHLSVYFNLSDFNEVLGNEFLELRANGFDIQNCEIDNRSNTAYLYISANATAKELSRHIGEIIQAKYGLTPSYFRFFYIDRQHSTYFNVRNIIIDPSVDLVGYGT
jgi:hypothetical protein